MRRIQIQTQNLLLQRQHFGGYGSVDPVKNLVEAASGCVYYTAFQIQAS